MNNSVYQVANFGFSYPFSQQQITLSGNFTIYAGDWVLLQGASGSGKSTLLAALKGLIPHLIAGKLSGSIYFQGQDIATLNEAVLLKIGYLQQNPDSQLLCRDVFSELAFGLENQGHARAQILQKITTTAAQFAISHLLNRDVMSLSGGEKQKINLVAILLLEPEVLLLDEPTAFLDPAAATAIMAIIAVAMRHKTVIIIEHNLHYLRQLISRNLYIDDQGQINELDLKQINWHATLNCAKAPRSQREPIVELRQLSFGYPEQPQLLKNINLQLYPGEIVAIHGVNGAGKSSLLKLLSAVIPSRQQLWWQETAISRRQRRWLWQRLSLLWQNPESHFLATTVAAEVSAAALAQFNLSRHHKSSPFNLSEGQKRRLSLAIVLQNQPQLLLLDEPTFGQDFANKQNLATIISGLAANGVSILMVSHDLAFIHALAGTIYQLEDGDLHRC